MKSFIYAILISVVLISVIAFTVVGLDTILGTQLRAEDDTILKPQKFKVVISITYNSLTLAEAAEKEAAVRNGHSKACGIQTKLDSIDYASFVVGSTYGEITNDITIH